MQLEFAKAVVGSLLRWLLAGLSGYLIREGALTEGQVNLLIIGLAGLIVSLVWSLAQKYIGKERLQIALSLPRGSTVADIRAAEVDQRSLKRGLVCLMLAASLLPTQTACGSTALKVVKAGSEEISVSLASAGEVIDAFVQANRMTAEEAELKRASFARLDQCFRAFNSRIQQLKKFDASAVAELLPLAESFVAQLDAENIVNLSHPETKARFAEVQTILRLVAVRIVARLRSKSAAPSFSERRAFASDIERLKFLLTA